jgi:ribulose bisphosphate carboxylase small subunit
VQVFPAKASGHSSAGKEYTTSGKPKTGFWSTDNNLNMKDIAGIE